MNFKQESNKASGSTEKSHTVNDPKVTKSDPRYSIFHKDSRVYIFLHKHSIASFLIIIFCCFAITALLVALIVFISYLTH